MTASAATAQAAFGMSLMGFGGAGNVGLLQSALFERLAPDGSTLSAATVGSADVFSFQLAAEAFAPSTSAGFDADTAEALVTLTLENLGASDAVFSLTTDYAAEAAAADAPGAVGFAVASVLLSFELTPLRFLDAAPPDQNVLASPFFGVASDGFSDRDAAISVRLGVNSGPATLRVRVYADAYAETMEPAPITPIPLPGTAALLLAAIAGLGAPAARKVVGLRRRTV